MGRQQDSGPRPARPGAQEAATCSPGGSGPRHALTRFVPDPELVARLLAENVDDYMSLGFFTHLISSSTGTDAVDVRGQCMGYLDHMLAEGYMVVGTVLETVFLPWVLGAAQTHEAISRQWPEAGGSDYETLRDIGWLLNTFKGNDVGRNYRTRYRWPDSKHSEAGNAERIPWRHVPR